MFPTSGYFRALNCPYYLSGLCERPYCHFRHVKQDDQKPLSLVASSATRQNGPHAPAAGRRHRQRSSSSSSGGGGCVQQKAEADDYTPTPICSLPTPAASDAGARRRPLLLPAPKAAADGVKSTTRQSQRRTADYDPLEYSPTKRSRRQDDEYQPTPIDGNSYGGGDDDDDDDDDEYQPTPVTRLERSSSEDEYCPTEQTKDTSVGRTDTSAGRADTSAGRADTSASRTDTSAGRADTSAAEAATAGACSAGVSSHADSVTDRSRCPERVGGSSSSSIKSVYRDIFGDDPPVARPTPKPRRPSAAEMLQLRAQRVAQDPSALPQQGKVRAQHQQQHQHQHQQVPLRPLSGSVANKIPQLVRQKYLERLADECRLVCSSDSAAVGRAQQEELACYERSANRNVYLNVVINAIKRIQHGGSASPAKAEADATRLSVKKLHKRLRRYLMTEEQLKQQNFPPDLPPLPYTESTNSLERVCARCGVAFLLELPDKTVPAGQCCYHYGRAFNRRLPGAGFQHVYTCCGEGLQAKGCMLADRHVHEFNVYSDSEGFVSTKEPDESMKKKRRLGVFAMDCEMLYTEAGKELARVTVIDKSLQVVYDRLVRPSAGIVDCNTRFSGITEQQLSAATHNLRQVQADLLQLFPATCILIGHSLENDLQSLKLVHRRVVDTSIVFPHRLGLPKKRALKNLASELLNKIIQCSDSGHDSSEDAITCMELMLLKVTEDMKSGK